SWRTYPDDDARPDAISGHSSKAQGFIVWRGRTLEADEGGRGRVRLIRILLVAASSEREKPTHWKSATLQQTGARKKVFRAMRRYRVPERRAGSWTHRGRERGC
ncbi:unnamed protein product, partial [Hapterophycus canaliculatus]